MNKIYYNYQLWEDYISGMYKKGFTKQKEKELIDKSERLLKNPELLYTKMRLAVDEWKHSAEINLSNNSCNKQAWLGAAACCIAFNCPEHLTKLAWRNLTPKQKIKANEVADKIIKEFELEQRGERYAQTTFK